MQSAPTLAEQLADLEDPTPKDVDPEDDIIASSDSDSSKRDAASNDAARGHYVPVAKSTLRSRHTIPLDSRYRGLRVGRTQAFEEDNDSDLFKIDLHDGSGSELSISQSGVLPRKTSADVESDLEHGGFTAFKTSDKVNGTVSSDDASLGSGNRFRAEVENGEENYEEDDHERDDYEENDNEVDANEADDYEESGDDNDQTNGLYSEVNEEEMMETDMNGYDQNKQSDRAELRKIISDDQDNVAARIASATKADAEKGEAVKRQRAAFDTYLNTRIRLQKALIATNSLSLSQPVEVPDGDLGSVISRAELAALRLWHTLDAFRQSLPTARSGEKRKRVELSSTAASGAMWDQMRAYEAHSLPNRRAVLEKWSAKARVATVLPASRSLNNTAAQQSIVEVLSDQLSNSERLTKRTRTPRSCAPLHVTKGIGEAREIYDDADFYGLLLKEFLEQQSVNTVVNMQLDGALSHYQAARDAKAKKNVDTKASKGRKLRYIVHEKLQNFMAPEDRGTWDSQRSDELFGSLFGRKFALEETVRPEQNDKDDLEAQSLLLFGDHR